ncbi:MAG: amidohydrolase [Paracoccaceae bacterium]
MTIDLVAFRRDLHAHPETGLELPRTAEKVAAILSEAGLEVTRGVGGHGVVATLRRGSDNDAIGFRADMDALPITELNTFDHASTVLGKFHGCGHDGHTTMLLGTALQLAQDETLDRTIHFIFQPDEENGTGARAMIDDGLFDRFPMRAVYGLHNWPGAPLGEYLTGPGPFFAFEDNFEIRITGKGGHAAVPEIGVDPLVTGSAMVLQLQTIVSRAVAGRDHAVVSVTEFVTDGARNILPTHVTLRGDCRGYSDEISNRIETRMKEIAAGVAQAQGASVEVDYSTSFHPLYNDPAHTERLAEAAAQVGRVETHHGRFGTSEDFAEFLRHRPGAFILMGNGTNGAHAMPLHNAEYDFNDEAIPHGIAFWSALAETG